MSSECHEVARNMPTLPKNFQSMDDARYYVRQMMLGESVTVIDNVAWSLLQRSKQEGQSDQAADL